jgi:Protein of unknown function (DUF2690)
MVRPFAEEREVLKQIGAMLASALMATVIASVGLASSASPANATCNGFSCHGLDPSIQGCTATSTRESSDTLAIVQNRFSQGCKANWARGALTQTGLHNGDKIQVIIQTTDSHGNFEQMCFPGPSNTGNLKEPCSGTLYQSTTFAFTDMVDGTNVAAAIVKIYDSGGNFIRSIEADQ